LPRVALRIAPLVAPLLAGLLLTTLPAGAKDQPKFNTPKFRPGLWQFERTLEVNGVKTEHQLLTSNLVVKPRDIRCVSPAEALRTAPRPIFLGNCRVTRSQPSDNDYVTMTSCGPGDPVKSELKVESDTAYTEIHEGKIGASTTRDTVVARRIGDCHR